MRKYTDEEINARLDDRVSKHNKKVIEQIIVKFDNDYNEEEINKTYGYLTVKRYIGKDKHYKSWFEFECICGRRPYYQLNDIKTHLNRACGCMRVNHAIDIGRKSATHGVSDTRLYNIYRGMYKRCYKPSHKSYEFYGGRGITICNEWLNDRTKFFEWAYDNGYTDELTIDRIDSAGNYCPSNCRWVSQDAQINNRKTNVDIAIGFSKYTISQWCVILDIPKTTVFPRIYKGWDPIDALLTPKGNSKPNRDNRIIVIPDKYIPLNKFKNSELY